MVPPILFVAFTLFSVLLVHLSLSILITKCKIITGEFQKAYIYFVPFDSIHFRTVCLWKLLMLTTGVVFHDAIYQFLRIFYHSRFKPDNLQMTLAQWAMPIVDLVFLVGPLLQIKRLRLIICQKSFFIVKNFSSKIKSEVLPEIFRSLVA